jgi:imidazole glycerol phosphate synthase subunit HisF
VKQARILPCIDVDLHRGVSGRQFKNIFPRGDEASRALGSLEHPDRREYRNGQ